MKKKKVQPKSAAAPQTESYIHSTRIFRWEKHHNVQDIWEHICMTCSILLLQSSILLLITVNLLEPDILECEVKQALESITTNKASGGDGIPVELFQILKGDAVKVLHSINQQIWKTQQWPQDWKRSIFIPIPKKGNAKECSNYHTIVLISHATNGNPLQCSCLENSRDGGAWWAAIYGVAQESDTTEMT